MRTAHADDRGRFEVPCPAGKAIIYGRSPAGDLAGYTVVDGQGDREVAIIAGPAATARGRVVDEDGKPWVSGNVVYYRGTRRRPQVRQEVLTDDDGRYVASGLPVGTRCSFYSESYRGRATGPHAARR